MMMVYVRVIKTMISTDPLTSVDLLSDGSTLVVGSSRGRLSVYDLRKTAQPVHSQTAHHASISCVSSVNKQTSVKVQSHIHLSPTSVMVYPHHHVLPASLNIPVNHHLLMYFLLNQSINQKNFHIAPHIASES